MVVKHESFSPAITYR